ncbi:hypothetical protein SPAR1_2313 [Streptococcus pneumoniae GA02254]|nr:hypothetical protein SPAR1_2313 [Streptococcus pneumoniae GA02254]
MNEYFSLRILGHINELLVLSTNLIAYLAGKHHLKRKLKTTKCGLILR